MFLAVSCDWGCSIPLWEIQYDGKHFSEETHSFPFELIEHFPKESIHSNEAHMIVSFMINFKLDKVQKWIKK